MIDESHPAFSRPDQLERDMRRLHESLRDIVDADGASGTFTSTADRMQGHVITRRTIIGVWADRNGKDRLSRAVFYQVNGVRYASTSSPTSTGATGNLSRMRVIGP